MSNDVEIEISGREAWLILEYGYPFPEQAELFNPISKERGYYSVKVDRYWLEMILEDLCRSYREVKSASLQDELEALCDTLEVSVGHAS